MCSMDSEVELEAYVGVGCWWLSGCFRPPTWSSRHSPLLGDKAFAESQALHSPSLLQPEFTHLEDSSTESSVDDLGTCRGVVLRRAASILRSIETQPLTGRFVRSVGQSSLLVCVDHCLWSFAFAYVNGHMVINTCIFLRFKVGIFPARDGSFY